MDSDLDEARRRVQNIRSHLPSSISVGVAGGARSVVPYLLLWVREALIWRTEELGRCACDMLERDDLAAGILLTRAVTESAAFVWRLKELLETRHQYSPDDLNDNFVRMVLGWKSDPARPQAVNIVTMIERMDKKFPGVKRAYDHLSEYAHPNWRGVVGLFSSTDEDWTTEFGRGLTEQSREKGIACILLHTSLGLFEYAYKSISDTLPEFIAELKTDSEA